MKMFWTKAEEQEVWSFLGRVEEGLAQPPGTCPMCQADELHAFFMRYSLDGKGGGWVWCSHCQNYLHFQARVPEWWVNMESIPLSRLGAAPGLIAEKAAEIDEHVRQTQPQRSDS